MPGGQSGPDVSQRALTVLEVHGEEPNWEGGRNLGGHGPNAKLPQGWTFAQSPSPN